MMYIVVAAWTVTLLCAFVVNSDLMSPAKLYLVTFALFHVGGVLGPALPHELWFLVLLVLCVGVLMVVTEALIAPRLPPLLRQSAGARAGRLDAAERRLFRGFWVVSLPALFAQGYMVQHFGGLEGYINALAFRVVEWQGLGWAKTLSATLMPINLAYFACGLLKPRRRLWWLFYLAHLACLLLFGLLSGSRSGILNIFALQAFCYHYIKRPIKIRTALTFASGLVVASLVLAVVRDGVKVDDGVLVTGLDSAESGAKVATFYYGIDPLEYLVADGVRDLAYGSTFVSLLTNAIPRVLWPEKPDTGGVHFTKVYTGDAWDGASNLTPTFLGEWVINFGWVAGVVLFLISYPMLMHHVIRFYRATRIRLRRDRRPRMAFDLLIYIFIMWSSVALMVGEVTNVVLTTLLTQLLPLWVLRTLLLRPIRLRARALPTPAPPSRGAAGGVAGP